jgi:hypothetical protein
MKGTFRLIVVFIEYRLNIISNVNVSKYMPDKADQLVNCFSYALVQHK